ncbi:MAG: EscU/YscU/HrcU family type III secretion system export apparatus switch protein [Oscillospiraceae bacterium]|jgi:flagellar biosynthesis protein|nr:EscU/YscU/HrcU family type III secretion system export apparatus switch protein [Oscillospiraceae bacterium]
MSGGKNTPRRAAALKYDPESDGAPVLTAFGEGLVADRIIEKAVEADVPVVTDESLAAVLARLSVGDEIPAELYEVVARVLMFVGDADRNYGRRVQNAAEVRGL